MPKGLKVLDRRHRGEISKIVTFANWAIWGVTGLIALVFAGITLKDIPIDTAISNTNPAYFQAVLLTIYIWCWAIGTAIDTNAQSSVYLVDPAGGRVRMGAIAAIASLAAISLVLLLVRSNELYFALAMAAFTTIDILGWLYLRYRFLPPIIQATQKKCASVRDYYGVILLNKVVAQVAGNWKWWRQLALSAIVLVMVLVALSPHLKDLFSVEIQNAVSAFTPGSVKPLLQDFLLLLFILVSEVWHFALRLKTYTSISVVNELENEYEIRPRQKV
jgi:hypothetical protein